MGGLGIILVTIGAILAFAVTTAFDGLHLGPVGVVLMIAGAMAVVTALAQGTFLGFHRTTVRTIGEDGRDVVEKTRTSSF